MSVKATADRAGEVLIGIPVAHSRFWDLLSAGVASPRTSAFQQFYSFGFGGNGIIPKRDKDQFGSGYYYMKLSGDIPGALRRRLSLAHEQDGRVVL